MAEPQPKQQSQKEEPKEPRRTVCLVSHATFGHHLNGYHLPRNVPVLLEIATVDFDEESQRPVVDSWLGKEIATHPGLLEPIDESDERFTGRKAADGKGEIKQPLPAKRIKTVRVCAFSKLRNGHYRARVFWASDAQAPIVYDVPERMLRDLERDPNLMVLSPSKPGPDGKRREQIPPGAISGADYFQALAESQQQVADEDEVFERVKARKRAEEENRQHVTRVNGS